MRVADWGDRDPRGEVEDTLAVASEEPASLTVVDLKPRVVAEDGRQDPGGPLFEGGGGLLHLVILGAPDRSAPACASRPRTTPPHGGYGPGPVPTA